MEKEIAIKVEGVNKTFKIPHEKISSLRGAFVSAFKKNTYEEFQVYPVADATGALDNVSFEACPKRCAYRCGRVKKGEFFACLPTRQGIIGRKISKSIVKEIFLKNVLIYVKNSINTAFFQVLTGFSEVAIINSLKPPVLTARHGGVLFLNKY